MSFSIPCPIHENARQKPQAEAIRWSTTGRVITWLMLSHYVSSTVRHLKEFNIRPESRVILTAGFDPSFVIVVLSLWRMGASVTIVGADVPDFEFVQIANLLHPALVITNSKRRIKARQLLLEEAVALEEIKDFWYGSEDAGPEIDPRREALATVEDGRVVSVPFADLFSGRFTPKEEFLQQIAQSLRSGLAIVV